MTSNPDLTGVTKADPDRLIIHIPKRQRIDDSEYVEDEDHGKESTGHRVIVKKAHTSSSALPCGHKKRSKLNRPTMDLSMRMMMERRK